MGVDRGAFSKRSPVRLDSNRIDYKSLKEAGQNIDAARQYARSALYVLERNLEIGIFSQDLKDAMEVLEEISHKIKCLLGYEPDVHYKTTSELEDPQTIRDAFTSADVFLARAKEATVNAQLSVGEANCLPWFEEDMDGWNNFVYLMNDVRSQLMSIHKRALAAPAMGMVNLFAVN